MRHDGNNNSRSSDMDKFYATNYLPPMTEVQREEAEKILESFDASVSLSSHEDTYLATRILQRHAVEENLSLRHQLQKFPWLNEVSTIVV